MSRTFRKTSTHKWTRVSTSGHIIKVKKEVRYNLKVPKNIDVGEFTHMTTYEEVYQSFTYNDMVKFETMPTPIGVLIKTISIYPQLNDVQGYGDTHHLAMRNTFEQLIKIVVDARKQKTLEDRPGFL